MTREEAEAIAQVISTADGGCSTCISGQIEFFEALFPQFKLTLDEDRVWYDTPDPDYPDEKFEYPVITITEIQS